MHCQKNFFQKTFVLFCLSILVLSCQRTKEAPPFPIHENEYDQPEVKDFVFPEPDTLFWQTENFLKLKSPITTKFDWDKLPSKPFIIDQSYPLKTPITTQSFDWNALPSEPFHVDSLPKKPLKVKVSDLGEPKVIKAGNMVNANGTTRGVKSFDGNFGLPSTPTNYFIDKSGIIWFGLNAGIASYDAENINIYGLEQGVETKIALWFYEDSQDRLWMVCAQGGVTVLDKNAGLVYELSSSFPSNTKYSIAEDKEGRMWIANVQNGFDIVDLDKREIWQFGMKNGLLGANIGELIQDKKGQLWLTGEKGVNIIDLENGLNKKLTTESGIISNDIFSAFEDKKGKIWLPSVGSVQILDIENAEISIIRLEQEFEEEFFFTNVFQDHMNKFWIATDKGYLYRFDEANNVLEKFNLNAGNNWLFNIQQDDQKEIWIARGSAPGGIFKIDLNSARPGNYTSADGLSDSFVASTLETEDGNMWIGTAKGVDVFDPITHTIKHIGLSNGLVDEFASTLYKDEKGRIWVGSRLGYSIIDPEKETITQQKLRNEQNFANIFSILEKPSGSFWLIFASGEIVNLDLDQATMKTLKSKDSLFNTSRKQWIARSTDNYIWIGDSQNGLYKIDPVKKLSWHLTEENGLISNGTFALEFDKDDNLWVVGDKGVQMIDEANHKITTFTTAEGLPVNDVYDVIFKDDQVFLASSNGLTILEQKKDGSEKSWTLKTLGKNQGLDFSDFFWHSLTFDKKGRLWAGVEREVLTVMDVPEPDTTAYPASVTSLNVFDTKLKFKNRELAQTSYDQIDTLWQYTKNDFVTLDKSKIDSSYQSTHHITWETVEGPYGLPVKLTLPADQNYLSFNYNGRQFSNPDKVVYRYILEGIDKQWSPITSNTTSENYRDLPPGEYTFKVAAKGFNGIWSKPAEFSFKITPPWWQTWWAYIFYVLIGLLLVWLIHKFQKARTIRIEREKSKDKELEQAKEIEKAYTELKETQKQLIQSEKMASLGELTAGIAHEIQNPMNFINNFSEVSSELMSEMVEELDKGEIEEAKLISKDIIQNLEKIGLHGKRASSIVKGMLEHSRNSSGKKELTDINVLADEYLRLAYHGLRAKDKSFSSDFKTDLDETLPKVEIIPQDLGRVVLNLINNAFYAVSARAENKEDNYKPLVTVTTKNLKDQVLIKIKDNGTGIPPELKDKIFQPFFTTKPTGKGTGLGLSLAYDIVTTGHGGAIELDTKQGEGTEFSIYIPIQKD
ncbi:MAG: two-component regulator propeller domain-containing protein [Lutimonas sp.]